MQSPSLLMGDASPRLEMMDPCGLDVATAETLMTLKGHTRRVTSVAFSPDGECLASAAPDSSIRIWSARTGAPLAVLHVPAIGVNAIAFSPDVPDWHRWTGGARCGFGTAQCAIDSFLEAIWRI